MPGTPGVDGRSAPAGMPVVTVAERVVGGGLGCPGSAGLAARAGYGGVLDAAHEQDRGRAGPGLVRVCSAAAKYRVWRRTLAGCSVSREQPWRRLACLQLVGSRDSWWSCDEVSAGVVQCGAFRCAVPWPVRCAAEPGAVPAFRFVLVSVLRGQCPWLSVRSAGLGARGHGHIADSVAAATLPLWCLRRSEGIWRCRQERSVKPSAQPTLVRTQHLPPVSAGQSR
jgi:hypothetical protein